jgi:hypothetical protein
MEDDVPVQQAAVTVTHAHVKVLSIADLLNPAYFTPPVGPIPWNRAVMTWAKHDVIRVFGL